MIKETDTNGINRTDLKTTTIGMKKRTKIGFWNVRTLRDDSRLAQAEDNLLRYNLLFLGLTEVRRNGFGEVQAPQGCTLLFSGKEDENDTSEYGVGFLLSKEAKKSLIDWRPISERLAVARFNSRARKISVIICYAPTNVADTQAKEDFYSLLTKSLSEIKTQDIVILLGDLNARIGSDNKNFEKCMGSHGLGVKNENGQMFVEMCSNHNLVIGGSLFPHKDCHKYTWTHPAGLIRAQLDHIAISARWRGSLLDVRNRRGADIDSDHELVVAQVRLKVATPHRPSVGKVGKRYDVQRLRSKETQAEFKIELRKQYENMKHPGQDINVEWNQMKMVYNETSSKILGHKAHAREDWISDRSWDLIRQRKLLKEKIVAAPSDSTLQHLRLEYKNLRKKIYRSVRRDKREWADKIADTAEAAAKRGDMRDLYNATKTLAGKNRPKKRPLRSKAGDLITTAEGQLLRWREHFTEVFLSSITNDNLQDPQPLAGISNKLDISTDPPSATEIHSAIRTLKDGKAPGSDLIASEMLKSDISSAVNMLTPLLSDIWDQELIPEEWRTGLLITVPKKGDLSKCCNWRGITLLPIPSKVLSKIILDRLSKAVEPLIRNEQAGFRPGRSCTDQINTLRIILEQASEFQNEIHALFVDFEKAFDTLHWSAIWSRLEEVGVPTKIINLVKAMYHNYSCRVCHDGLISDPIEVSAGVRQGCLLSPLLFLVVLDGIMLRVNEQVHQGIDWEPVGNLQDLDYADDLCLLSNHQSDIQNRLDVLKSESAKAGLKINVGKTKYLRTGDHVDNAILVGTEEVEMVSRFTYLGSVVAGDGGTDLDVSSRIDKAKGAFACLRSVWQSKHLSRRVKLKIFNTNVKSVLLYGCETWKTTKTLTQKLQVFINRCLRQILKIFWPNTISNVDLWKRCHEDPVGLQIKRRKWSWIGHTLRRDQNHIPRQALDWNPQGKRKRGRPKQTWRRSIDAEMQDAEMTWSEVKLAAVDRQRWRTVVSALCPTGGS